MYVCMYVKTSSLVEIYKTMNTGNWESKFEVKRSKFKVKGNENVKIFFRAHFREKWVGLRRSNTKMIYPFYTYQILVYSQNVTFVIFGIERRFLTNNSKHCPTFQFCLTYRSCFRYDCMIAQCWNWSKRTEGVSDIKTFEILPRDWILKPIFSQKWASVNMNWEGGWILQAPGHSNPVIAKNRKLSLTIFLIVLTQPRLQIAYMVGV